MRSAIHYSECDLQVRSDQYSSANRGSRAFEWSFSRKASSSISTHQLTSLRRVRSIILQLPLTRRSSSRIVREEWQFHSFNECKLFILKAWIIPDLANSKDTADKERFSSDWNNIASSPGCTARPRLAKKLSASLSFLPINKVQGDGFQTFDRFTSFSLLNFPRDQKRFSSANSSTGEGSEVPKTGQVHVIKQICVAAAICYER